MRCFKAVLGKQKYFQRIIGRIKFYEEDFGKEYKQKIIFEKMACSYELAIFLSKISFPTLNLC